MPYFKTFMFTGWIFWVIFLRVEATSLAIGLLIAFLCGIAALTWLVDYYFDNKECVENYGKSRKMLKKEYFSLMAKSQIGPPAHIIGPSTNTGLSEYEESRLNELREVLVYGKMRLRLTLLFGLMGGIPTLSTIYLSGMTPMIVLTVLYWIIMVSVGVILDYISDASFCKRNYGASRSALSKEYYFLLNKSKIQNTRR